MRSVLGIVVCLTIISSGAIAEDAVDTCQSARINFRFVKVDRDIAVSFASEMCRLRQTVQSWWGRDFVDEIFVDIDVKFREPKALSLIWRDESGRIEIPTKDVQTKIAAPVAMLIQVHAPNQNRFLAEGLAVCAQETLSRAAVYPAFGTNLHVLARTYGETADIEVLDRIAMPATLDTPNGPDATGARVVAGSFVCFLIRAYGFSKFRELYNLTQLVPWSSGGAGGADRWEKIYGTPLGELVRDWRAVIEDRAG